MTEEQETIERIYLIIYGSTPVRGDKYQAQAEALYKAGIRFPEPVAGVLPDCYHYSEQRCLLGGVCPRNINNQHLCECYFSKKSKLLKPTTPHPVFGIETPETIDKSGGLANQPVEPEKDRIYPCEDCGKMRTKDEGGTTFTICDECWEKHYPPKVKLSAPVSGELRSKIVVLLKQMGLQVQRGESAEIYYYADQLIALLQPKSAEIPEGRIKLVKEPSILDQEGTEGID
jgi:hypothetical protein